MTPTEVRALYRDGMVEAKRVLKRNGLLWVKCKDQVGPNGVQHWQHVEVFQDALALGFSAKDFFPVLTGAPNSGARRASRNTHLRIVHSCGYFKNNQATVKVSPSKSLNVKAEREDHERRQQSARCQRR